MNKRNRRLLHKLLSEAMISEEKEESNTQQKIRETKEKEDAEKESAKEEPSDYGHSKGRPVTLDGGTDNSLGQGRPPGHVTDTRELAADPTRAKELLKKLGVPSGGLGSNLISAVEGHYSSASKHRDFGQLVTGVRVVRNSDGTKKGVKIEVASAPMGSDAKAVYFFLRSLFTAAINATALNIQSSHQAQMRIEKADKAQNTFVFYQGKNAKSWN